MSRSTTAENHWLRAIFACYLLSGLAYSLAIPIWEAPDEQAHYRVVKVIVREGSFPSRRRNHEAYQPPLYYWAASLPLRVLDKVQPDWVSFFHPGGQRGQWARFTWDGDNYRFLLGVYLLRWGNLALGLATLWVLYRAFKLLLPGQLQVIQASLTCIALLPQYVYICASVTNDPAAFLAGALLFWMLVAVHRQAIRGWAMLAVVVAAAVLPLAVKLTVLPVAAAAVLVVAWNLFRRLSQRQALLLLLLAGVLVAGVLFAIGMQSSLGQRLLWRAFHVRDDFSLPRALLWISWSFWGLIGGFAHVLLLVEGRSDGAIAAMLLRRDPGDVGLSGAVTVGLSLLATVGVAASALCRGNEAAHRGQGERSEQRAAWLIVWLIVVLAVATLFKNAAATRWTQGRHLFPALGPVMLLIVGGWHRLLPETARLWLTRCIAAILLGLHLALWGWGILPAFYQPWLD
jgi:hypothetical protein